MGRVALIAGKGEFPLLMARELHRRGQAPLILALGEEADPAFEREFGEVHRIPVGKVGKILGLFRSEGVDRAVVAGKVEKTRIFHDLKPDLKALTLLWSLRDRKDDTIMLQVAEVLRREGIELLPQTTHMEAFLPAPGVFTRRRPTGEEEGDVAFGLAVAREMGRLDIGQTVVVKRGAVLAVEAIEGTDRAIARGGELGRGGAVVVKVAKPKQDLRFDVPAIGAQTVRSCIEAKVAVLAVEAGRTLFFQREEAVALADAHGIAITAFSADDA